MSDLDSTKTDAPSPTRNWWLTGTTGALCLLLGILYAFVTPSFKSMFDDLGKELPLFSRLAVSIPAIGYVSAGILSSALVFLKSRWVHARACLLLDMAVATGCFISFWIMVVVLFLPLIGDLQNIK